MTAIERAERAAGRNAAHGDPSSVFKFRLQERVQCLVSNRVKYTTNTDSLLTLPIPLEHATNLDDVAAFEVCARGSNERGGGITDHGSTPNGADVGRPRLERSRGPNHGSPKEGRCGVGEHPSGEQARRRGHRRQVGGREGPAQGAPAGLPGRTGRARQPRRLFLYRHRPARYAVVRSRVRPSVSVSLADTRSDGARTQALRPRRRASPRSRRTCFCTCAALA